MYNNVLALLAITNVKHAADPLTHFSVHHGEADNWQALVAFEQGRKAECSADTLDEAVGAALAELALGRAVKGRLNRDVQNVMAWLNKKPGRKLDVEWEKEMVPAWEWDQDADEDEDIWLTVAVLSGGKGPIEGRGESIQDAIEACGRHKDIKK